jgi:hypothetical protein
MLPLASHLLGGCLRGAASAGASRSNVCRLSRPRAGVQFSGRPLCAVSAAASLAQPAGEAPLGKARGQVAAQALAVATERTASGEEDAPRDPVAAAEYRKLLDAEEEAGLFEEPEDGDAERVEVDASAQPDDSLAVRAGTRFSWAAGGEARRNGGRESLVSAAGCHFLAPRARDAPLTPPAPSPLCPCHSCPTLT